MLHKANIAGMTVDPASNTPIIILRLPENNQAIPIWIGLFEATAIASALQNIQFARPMTHDLIKNLLLQLNITVSSIEISDIQENTFYAKINFTSIEKNFSIDARPSDAVAVALRFNAPIFVDDKVIKKTKDADSLKTDSLKTDSVKIFDKGEEGEEWTEYLKNLSPEDFGKYKA